METKRLKVSGIAITEGISRNKMKYTAEELRKFAPSLVGKPILKDHQNLTDQAIGKVTHAESINNGKAVRYEGWIQNDSNDTLGKVKNKIIENVSIGAIAGKVIKENEGDEYTCAQDLEALELSLTPCPGIANATIKPHSEEAIKDKSQNCKTCGAKMKMGEDKKMYCPTCDKEDETDNATDEDTEKESVKININESPKVLKYEDGKAVPKGYELKTCSHCGRKALIPDEEMESEVEDKLEDGEGEEEGKVKAGEDRKKEDLDEPTKDDGDDNTAGHEKDEVRAMNNPEYNCPYCGGKYEEDMSDKELQDMDDEAQKEVGNEDNYEEDELENTAIKIKESWITIGGRHIYINDGKDSTNSDKSYNDKLKNKPDNHEALADGLKKGEWKPEYMKVDFHNEAKEQGVSSLDAEKFREEETRIGKVYRNANGYRTDIESKNYKITKISDTDTNNNFLVSNKKLKNNYVGHFSDRPKFTSGGRVAGTGQVTDFHINYVSSGINFPSKLIGKKESVKTEEIKLESKESCSSSIKEDLLIMKMEDKKMESEKITESVKVDEKMVAELEEAKKTIATLKEAQRQDAITSYTEKAKAKGVASLDVSNMSMESIKALTAQVESIKVEAKVEVKEVAKTKTVEVVESAKPKTDFSGYIVEHSEMGGLAFGKF